MPISNTRADPEFELGEKAVTTFHLDKAAVTEPKLADLAVTVDKTDAPTAWDRALGFEHNTTIDTTDRLLTSVNIDVPTWAGLVLLMCWGQVRINATGAPQIGLDVKPFGDGVFSTYEVHKDWASGAVDFISAADLRSESVPGSTVVAELWCSVLSGTSPQNNNQVQLEVVALFAR